MHSLILLCLMLRNLLHLLQQQLLRLNDALQQLLGFLLRLQRVWLQLC